MLVALILFLSGIAVGLTCRATVAVGLSALVVALSGMVWIARWDVSVVSLLVLFAHLTAVQAGYLLGAYLRVRSDGA
ncbi:hypothetical protein ASF49_16365 [Methylobacterium sp. Leaf104]|uniref:hypothetical protein n=1 Tax=Methylobacterium TaxID=407 RepID=UPI0006F42399|nr:MULTISPECIES: hypothetical protein [Methylobacterium]KQP29720.1 hypothetical protein ASF49_16365 [Methylobacterium sp. Leaf104]MCI9881721.1 hypothetical protein [Methylobacterium goesingense]